MKILALEFSSPQRSVAVAVAPAGEVLRPAEAKSEVQVPGSEVRRGTTKITVTDRRAAAGLPVLSATDSAAISEVIETARGNMMKPLSMITAALRQAGLEREQIECLVLGLGPGSYTGIRAAIALAQGWQLASGPGGLKLLGISSVEGIVAQAHADGIRGRVSLVVDAQRDEFYLASYEIGSDTWRETASLRLATLAEVRERKRAGEALIGPEVARWFPEEQTVFPRAAALARLAGGRTDFVAGERLEPIYLRETNFVKVARSQAIRL